MFIEEPNSLSQILRIKFKLCIYYIFNVCNSEKNNVFFGFGICGNNINSKKAISLNK